MSITRRALCVISAMVHFVAQAWSGVNTSQSLPFLRTTANEARGQLALQSAISAQLDLSINLTEAL